MLTPDQIKQINDKQESSEMGIYLQPYKIPNIIKGLVLYQRYLIGECSGGNCWDDTEPTYQSVDEVPEFTILDDVLEIICPNINFLQYNKLKRLICSEEYNDYQYYGNYDNYKIRYIVLDDLYREINKMQ